MEESTYHRPVTVQSVGSASDYSRFIVAWRLCTTMSARDVSDTLDDAIEFTSLDQVHIKHKPRLLSDNGSSYVASELKTYLDDQGMPIPEEGLTIQ